MASEEGLRAGEPDPLLEELQQIRQGQARQRQLFEEMARRLKAARVVVDAARVYVSTGRDRAGYGQLQAALEEHDKERDE